MARGEAPSRILVCVTATDRPAGLACLGHGIVEELERHGYGGWPEERACELLVVENSTAPAARERNRILLQGLERAGLPVELVDDGVRGRSIAASRLRQTEAVAARVRRGQRPDIVWMVDDDLTLAQLRLGADGVLREVSEIAYFHRLDTLRKRHPDLAVVLGGVTGDPPIRPDGVLRTQLLDLQANLERFAALAPDAIYAPPSLPAGFSLVDYYYDHSEAGDAHLDVRFPWLPRHGTGPTVREQMAALLDACAYIATGSTPTRPLVLDSAALPPGERRGFRRGGNTVFLDLDACLRHPYPSLLIDGVATRRADMIGTAWLARSGALVSEWPLPLLHRRAGQDHDALTGFGDGRLAEEAARQSLLAEFFGVLLVRLVHEGISDGREAAAYLERVARQRAHRIVGNLRAAAQLCDEVRAGCGRGRGAWWWSLPDIAARMDALGRSLEAMAMAYLGGTSPARRERFFTTLEAELLDERRRQKVLAAVRDLPDHIERHAEQVGRWLHAEEVLP